MKIKNCKCGSDAIFKCRDLTITPNKYWCECLSCGHIGGIIYSGHRFNKKTILQDGSEIINSAEDKSVVKWNMEVEEMVFACLLLQAFAAHEQLHLRLIGVM